MPAKRKNTMNKRIILCVTVLLLIGLFLLFSKLAVYIKPLFQLTFDKKITLKQTADKRINILLLGIGGGTHDGPKLTDTMLFASLDPESKKATLVSIPRDLWIPDKHEKINAIYANGESEKPGKGLQETKQVVSRIVGQPVDYGFRIDFNGFAKAVDTLGGVDVTVERTFDDFAYPISGKEDDICGLLEEQVASLSAQIATGSATTEESFPCRYKHLHFDKGLTHMDGDTALTFVRSRHAFGPEGTDFARSRRQQKIINAVKDKVFSAGTFLNPVKIIDLFNILRGSIDTDIKEDEYDDFIKLAQKMKNATTQSAVLDYGDAETERAGLLTDILPEGIDTGAQWVVIPRRGVSDYSEIHGYVYCFIKYGDECKITPLPPVR